MGKKKSIALLVIISVVLALLTAMTFANFHIPFVKEGVYNYNSLLNYADLDVDLEGGYSYTLTLNEDSDDVEDIEDVTATLADRLDQLGYSNYKVTLLQETADDEYLIRLDVKAKENTDSDIATVAAFGEIIFTDGDNNTLISGKEAIKDAEALEGYDAEGNAVTYVNIDFTDEGYNTILDAITTHETESSDDTEASDFTLKIILGGDYENPLLDSTITSETFGESVQVTVSSGLADAERLALQIRTGGLAYKYDVSDPSVLTPIYGVKVSTIMTIALFVVVAIVMVLMGVFFRGIGLAMDIALLAQLVLQLFLLWLVPGITVSIGSVIGIVAAFVLSAFVMALCANKIKKEYAVGKTAKAAIKSAYGKSLLTALDMHVVAGVLALALFIAAFGAVKGFAITFGIGVVVSMLVSLLFAHLMVSIMVGISAGKEAFLGVKREG